MSLSTQISHSLLRWKLIFNIIHQPHNDSGGTNKTDIYAIMSTYLKLWYATYSFTSHIMAVTWNVSIFTYVLRGYFSRISGQKQSIETWASKLYQGKLSSQNTLVFNINCILFPHTATCTLPCIQIWTHNTSNRC